MLFLHFLMRTFFPASRTELKYPALATLSQRHPVCKGQEAESCLFFVPAAFVLISGAGILTIKTGFWKGGGA